MLLGSQEPTKLVRPGGRLSYADADDAIELWESVSPPLYDYQRLTNSIILATRKGKPAVQTVGVSIPRQNGKTFGTLPAEAYWIMAGLSVLHTAHEVKTAAETFRDMLALFDEERGGPWARLVRKISHTNGKEYIELNSGGIWRISARSKGAARGFTVDKLVVDEALIADDDTQASLMPILSAARGGEPQMVLLGTPPAPGMPSDWFRRARSSALDGKDKSVAWVEFSAEAGDDLDTPSTWAKANPAYGRSLIPAWIETEHAQFPADKFRRERLGMWDEDAAHEFVIPLDLWDACSDVQSQVDVMAEVAVAVDVGPSRSTSCISVAGWRSDGDQHVEVAEHQGADPSWVPGWLERFCSRDRAQPVEVRSIVVDDMSPAKALVPDIERLTGRKVTVTRSSDLTAGCGYFYDAVVARRLRHRDQPLLTQALQSATKRRVGEAGGWAWNRRDADADLTPLVGCTLALHGLVSDRVAKQVERRTNKVYMGSRW